MEYTLKLKLYDSKGRLVSEEKYNSYYLALAVGKNWKMLARGNKYEIEDIRKNKKNPPQKTVEIYSDIIAIEARKGKNSLWPNENFRHDFKEKGIKIYGLEDGSLLIKGKKRLWKKFKNYKKGIDY